MMRLYSQSRRPWTAFGNALSALNRLASEADSAAHLSTVPLVSNLAFEVVQDSSEEAEGPPLNALIIHGLFGSGRNWRTPARKLAEMADTLGGYKEGIAGISPWQMVLVDLRNHGKSAELEHLDPPHTLQAAGQDLVRLYDSEVLPWPKVVIGHSLGGKVALEYAKVTSQLGGRCVPKQVWVLDSVPGAVSAEEVKGDVEKVLDELHSVPEVIPSRQWLIGHMKGRGFSRSLAEWMGSNLKRLPGEKDASKLVFNPAGAQEMYDSYREETYIPFLGDLPKGMNIDIVQAERSDRWTPKVLSELKAIVQQRQSAKGSRGEAGQLQMHVLPNAGHWLHMDNPRGLVELLAPSLAKLAQPLGVT